MSRGTVIRVSNSFTRTEIRILKDIIDTATTREFRGRNHLMRYIENPNFSQLYRKLASMQDKADSLYSEKMQDSENRAMGKSKSSKK